MTEPRVRFAPSPTGHLHVGGARTALFNWLFARKEDGTFVLRIEDTDRERSSDEMTRSIVSALEWLGMEPDEGPFHQADGLDRHQRDGRRLLEAGSAYRCFCDVSEVEDREAFRGGCPGGCRHLDEEESAERAGAEAFALRFAVPGAGETGWEDAVQGRVSFDNESIEDFVVLRSDGSPLYNMAVVSDDVEMEISHVIRGDDHVSNTPKQCLIYDALGEERPVFAHVPMILGPDGKRLSKRHGAASVEAFRERGILPDAMVNFLALLGWSPGDDREIMDRKELIEAFSLDRILTKSAVFDTEKLEWINGQYIAGSPAEQLADVVAPRLVEEGSADPDGLDRDRGRLLQVLEAVKDRPRTVDALLEQTRPFFAESIDYTAEAVERFWSEPGEAAEHLRALRGRFEEIDDWEAGTLEEELRGLADERGEGAGTLIHPLRVALMGVAVSPGIFRVLELMEKDRTLTRIDQAVERLGELAATA